MKAALSLILAAAAGAFVICVDPGRTGYTIRQTVTSRGPKGARVFKMCRARRADGAYVVVVRYPDYKGDGWQYRRLYRTDGVSIAISDSTREKWNLQDWDAAIVSIYNQADDMKPEDCSEPRRDGRLIGAAGTNKGVPVFKYHADVVALMPDKDEGLPESRPRGTPAKLASFRGVSPLEALSLDWKGTPSDVDWIARKVSPPGRELSISWDYYRWPAGGCVEVASLQRAQENDNGRSSTQTVTADEVIPGSPDPRLFAVPPGYADQPGARGMPDRLKGLR